MSTISHAIFLKKVFCSSFLLPSFNFFIINFMSNLPPEILIEVFSYLSRDYKLQCLLACKTWYASALPILNREIKLCGDNDATLLLEKLSSRQDGSIEGSKVHRLSFGTDDLAYTEYIINRVAFSRILAECKNLKLLEFNGLLMQRYFGYLYHYRDTLQLDSLQVINAPFSSSELYIPVAHHYHQKLNQLDLDVNNNSFRTLPDVNDMFSYLRSFSALKILSLRFHCPIYLHDILSACPHLETLKLSHSSSVNHFKIFKSGKPGKKHVIEHTTGFRLKFLTIASDFVNQELFEYLLEKTTQLYQVSINGFCSDFTTFETPFNIFVNGNQIFPLKRIVFFNVNLSPKVINGLNSSFGALKIIQLDGCYFTKIMDQHRNIRLDFSKLNLEYMSIDFRNIIRDQPNINTVALEIKRVETNDTLFFQRLSKWKTDRMFIEKTHKLFTTDYAKERRANSNHISVIFIEINTLRYLRLHLNTYNDSNFSQIIALD